MVGEVDSSTNPPTYRIFSHKKLEIGYNENQVIMLKNFIHWILLLITSSLEKY